MLTVPTWIAAIATAVLAIGVILAAWVARTAFDAHRRQLDAQHELTAQLAEALALQSGDLRLSLEERRRTQACQVFIELDRMAAAGPLSAAPGGARAGAAPRVATRVHNTSQQPVYDLYVIWQHGTVRVGKPDRAARLLPGNEVCFERAPEPGADGGPADSDTLTAFLTFRDAAGVRWTVREDGTLSDISPAPDAR